MKMFNMIGAAGIALCTVAATSAASLKAYVPFSFVVAGQEFAAGDYNVQENENGMILVRGAGQGAMVLSVPSDAKAGAPASLRFARSQDREYLVGVKVEGEVGRSIPLHPNHERKLTLSR
ncbi:MAG: hypothetical protein WB992_19405 [Bryobacteraceae bacterium]